MILRLNKITDFSFDSFKVCYDALEENEKLRVSAKKSPQDQMCSLAARIVLKKVLAENYGINNPVIKRDTKGKPYLEHEKVYFSISHTCDTVAVAVSENPIGVDIEYVREYNDSVCRKMFSDAEIKFVSGDDTKFTKLWTLKEAAVKATGQGIANIKDYNFDISGKSVTTTIDNAVFTITQQDGLIISVCILN